VKVDSNNLSLVKHRLIALVFGITLMVPSLMQLEHILDGHKHIGCSQSTTHLHEVDHGCDLLAFHFNAAALSLIVPETQSYFGVLQTQNFWLIDRITEQTTANQTSRGPPHMI
jgi:hypothetical protein